MHTLCSYEQNNINIRDKTRENIVLGKVGGPGELHASRGALRDTGVVGNFLGEHSEHQPSL